MQLDLSTLLSRSGYRKRSAIEKLKSLTCWLCCYGLFWLIWPYNWCFHEAVSIHWKQTVFLLRFVFESIKWLNQKMLVFKENAKSYNWNMFYLEDIAENLTAHNWQKWKSRFLTCHCHKIYSVKAFGLSISNYA